jgi:hypothetical protein
MSRTKQSLIEDAFAEIAIQGFEFDLSPDELLTALRRLEAMLAVWEERGIRIGYAFAIGNALALDAESGIPDKAAEPVFLNLAMRLAPGYGKAVTPETRRAAAEGYATLLNDAVRPREQRMPSTMPKGQGNKPWRDTEAPFFPIPNLSPLQLAQGGGLDIGQE